MKKQEKTSNKQTKKVKEQKSIKALTVLTYTVAIILISLISFGGIYVQNKNKMSNKLREYILGTDLNASRNIVIKVDDGVKTTTYDENGNIITENLENTNTKTVEEPINSKEVLTEENYEKAKKIAIDRLKYMQLDYYEMKFDATTGTIYLEVPENSKADYAAQYCVTKGEFKISDNDTNEVLLSNSDIKNAKIRYGTTENGTTIYINIQFTKEGSEKLKEISKKYIQTTDSEGKTTTKKIKMTIDDSTIMSTYFSEEITDGQIQISLGTGKTSEQIQNYVTQASNIAVFLNTDPMPVAYKIDVNKVVYSNITENTVKIIIICTSIVFIILLVYMLIKYKKQALLAAITNIGFIAVLLLVIRYTNVDITLTGLATIALSTLVEYVFLMNILKVKTEKMDNESKQKTLKETIISGAEKLIPLTIIAIVFALTKWETVYSAGMLLFWGIAILVLYNLVTLKIILMKNEK